MSDTRSVIRLGFVLFIFLRTNEKFPQTRWSVSLPTFYRDLKGVTGFDGCPRPWEPRIIFWNPETRGGRNWSQGPRSLRFECPDLTFFGWSKSLPLQIRSRTSYLPVKGSYSSIFVKFHPL